MHIFQRMIPETLDFFENYTGYLTATGGHLEVDDEFMISAIETIDGRNYGVFNQADLDYQIYIVQFDSDWDWNLQAEFAVEIPDNGNFAYYSAEIDFGVDFNYDGAIGLPEVVLDDKGNTYVHASEHGLLSNLDLILMFLNI